MIPLLLLGDISITWTNRARAENLSNVHQQEVIGHATDLERQELRETDEEAKEEAMGHMPPVTKKDLEHVREVLAKRKEAQEKDEHPPYVHT